MPWFDFLQGQWIAGKGCGVLGKTFGHARRMVGLRGLASPGRTMRLSALAGFASRNGREQGLGIGGDRRYKSPPTGRFRQFPRGTSPPPDGRGGNHRQVVGNKDIAHAKFLLVIVEQVNDLGLHRHVEGRNRLPADNHIWFQREGAGDVDARR